MLGGGGTTYRNHIHYFKIPVELNYLFLICFSYLPLNNKHKSL